MKINVRINRLGLLLEAYRAEHEMTQEELAALIDVSVKTISKWEKGKGETRYVQRRSAKKLEKIGIVGGDK